MAYSHDGVEIFTTKLGWICVEPLCNNLELFRDWDKRLILADDRFDRTLHGKHIYYYFLLESEL